MKRSVLAIHGVSNRDRHQFRSEVDALATAVGGDLEWIDVFWGDLGAKHEFLDRVIPPVLDLDLEYVGVDTPPTYVAQLFGGPVGEESVAPQPVEIVVSAASEEVAAYADAGAEESVVAGDLSDAIRMAWDETTYLRHVRDPRMLRDVGRIVATAAAPDSREGVGGPIIGDVVGKVRSVFSSLDDLLAAAAGRVGGGFNQFLRGTFLDEIARFLGDVFVYQRARQAVQARIWEAIRKHASDPSVGSSTDNPVAVVAHSLGGVVMFDAAVAGTPPLHIDPFVTFGSQSPFFHLIDPRDGHSSTRLPPYLGGEPRLVPNITRWINLYEPLDPLAFIASNVFRVTSPYGVRDELVEHRPQAGIYTHSDYWEHPQLRAAIRDALGIV